MTRNWKKLYKTYIDNYNKSAINNLNQMADKYNMIEFKMKYTALENDRKKEILKGKRKILNIQQDIIRKQTYELSKGQALAVKYTLKETKGLDLKLRDIRRGKYGSNKELISITFREIADQYNDLIDSGYSTIQAKKMISTVYFGSEE